MIARPLSKVHVLDVADRVPLQNNSQLGLVLSAMPVYLQPGRGLALIDNGKVYAVTGLAPLWEGVAEAWFLPTREMNGKRIQTVRLVKRELDAAITRLKLTRVQAVVRSDFTNAHKLAKFLGFTSEGVMHKYGPDGLDYERYAKWKHCHF
tara:strand:+ start:1902 stop:2351 length:450 start_codon:yes stop_codon:yes gene_type:complete